MSTSSDSSVLTEQQHQPSDNHFTLVVNKNNTLIITLQKVHLERHHKVQWLKDGNVVVSEDGGGLDRYKVTKDCHRGDGGHFRSISLHVSQNSKQLEILSPSATAEVVKNYLMKLNECQAAKEDVGMYDCHIQSNDFNLKRHFKINPNTFEKLMSNKGTVLKKKIKEKPRRSNESIKKDKTQFMLPILSIDGEEEEEEEEDDEGDVVMDLPRIPSRIFSRAPSVEDDDLRISGALLPKAGKRFRRDSEASDTTDQGDQTDENEDPGMLMMKPRSRRMSSIDISKSAQQRLLKLSSNNSLKSPEDESPTSDMDLFKQKMLTLPQKSRRISLAEVIPDWPRLEKPALGQNHNSSGSNVNRLGLPQIKVDLEELEMKQNERRKSFSARSRRTSLADVIPDWPQLHKPKDKVENFLDDLEDVMAWDNDLRIELSCRFSKPNCKINWFKDGSEIFPGQKYNFLQDDNGVVRLIIQRLSVQDTGVYMCQVNDKHETKATLTVEETKVKYNFIRKMAFKVKAKQHKDLTLECVLNDTRGVVTWMKDDDVIEYTPGLYEISRRDQRCILKIPEVDMKLNGCKFECSVYGDNSICHLTVEEPEYEFVRRLTDQDAFENETAVFECEVNHQSAPLKWVKNLTAISDTDERFQQRVKGVRHRLVIKKVEKGDQGVYSCELSNKSSSARLFVSPELVILEHLACQIVLEHENIVLKARVKNPKNYAAQWFKDGIFIDSPDDHRLKIKADAHNEEHSLSIKNACLEDAGSYVCRWLSRESHANITVKKCQLPPYVDLDSIPKEISVKTGKIIKISIPYIGTPNPTSHWTKDGKSIKSDEHINLQQFDNKVVLLIESSKRTDQGHYCMNLTNECGETSVEMKIGVKGPPSAPQPPFEVINVYSNKCHLRWNKPKDDGGVEIEKYLVEVFDVVEQEVVQSKSVKGDTQCSVDALLQNHRYTFKVRACNSEGSSDWLYHDKEVIAKDPWEPPGKPGKPRVKSMEDDGVEIKWKPSMDDGGAPILKYVIEKRNINNNEWQTVGMVPLSDLCAVVPDLREGHLYEFRVVAVNKAGRGEWSDTSDVVEKKVKKGAEPQFEMPLKNTFVKEGSEVRMKTVVKSETSPTITWYFNETLIRESDRIQLINNQETGEVVLVIRDVKECDEGVISCDVTNAFGNVRSYAQLKLLVNPSFKKKKVAISMLQGEHHKEHIHFQNAGNFEWKLSTTCSGKQSSNKDDEVEVIANSDNSYFVFHVFRANLSMNFKEYSLKLWNNVGSDTCFINVCVKGCPSVCQGPLQVGEITRGSCVLSWKVPESDGGSEVTHYEVMKKEEGKGYWSSACNIIKHSSVKVDNLADGKKYFFKVAAVNQYGWSKFLESQEAVVSRMHFETPKPPGTPEPSDITSDSVKLSWSPSPLVSCPASFTESPITTYSIQKCFENAKVTQNNDKTWMDAIVNDMTSEKSGKCSCVVEGLVEGRKYCFRVVAENQAGVGGTSNESQWVTFTNEQGPPVIHSLEDGKVGVVKGTNASLKVKITGTPEPTVTWHRDKQQLKDSDKYKMGENGNTGMQELLIKDVVKEDEDEYVVRASNSQGTRSHRIQLIIQGAPVLHVPEAYKETVVKDKGNEVIIKMFYTAQPAPCFTCSKNNKELSRIEKPSEEEENKKYHNTANILSDFRFRRHSVSCKLMRYVPDSSTTLLENQPFSQRSSFELTSRFLLMKISNSQAIDNGEYELKLSNEFGEDKTNILIKINDVPEAPTHLQATLDDDNNYTLTWQKPEEDGGSVVTSYYVEVLNQQTGDQKWMPHVLSRFTKAALENLIKGKTYHFRVGAYNVFGKGSPSKSIKLVAGCAQSSADEVAPMGMSTSRSVSHDESRGVHPYSRRFSRTSADRFN